MKETKNKQEDNISHTIDGIWPTVYLFEKKIIIDIYKQSL